MLQDLLKKEMDRKEFLLHLGLIIISLTGISAFVKNFSELNSLGSIEHGDEDFGQGAYGGTTRKRGS